ncbi:hypothetical protein ACFLXP_05785 [Chloroflexota bacterium]
MSDIRSAREIAMEKIEKLGAATEDERLRWKYVPEGEKLAVKALKEDLDIASELDKYEEKARKYIVSAASEILIKNITLAQDDSARLNNERAMSAIKELKEDKETAENILSKMRRVFSHYSEQGEQQRMQAYESLKTEFEVKMQQALQQQMGSSMNINIDVEKQPQFQEEWHKLKSQLDSQYPLLLNEYKQELMAID